MPGKFIITVIALLFVLSSCKPTNEQLMEKASKYAKQKDYAMAIELYTQIISNNSKLQLAYYNRGLNYRDIKAYSKALSDFNKVLSLQTYGDIVIALNPNSSLPDEVAKAQVPYNDALYQRAQVKFYMDSLKSSFIDFQALVDNNYDEKSNCMLWQGVTWVKAGKPQKACEYFEKARQVAVRDDEKKDVEEMMQAYCR